MSYFTVDPEKQKAEAERKVHDAEGVLACAMECYEREKTPTRLTELLLARKSLKEALAMWQEWKR